MAKEGGGSVLIAAPTEAIAQTIRSVLPDGFYPVRHVSSMTLAKQRILREKTDILRAHYLGDMQKHIQIWLY